MSLNDILHDDDDSMLYTPHQHQHHHNSSSHRGSYTDPLDALLHTGSLRSTRHPSPGASSRRTEPHTHYATPDLAPSNPNQIPLSDPKATLKYVRKVERELSDLQAQHKDLCGLLMHTAGERATAHLALQETDARNRLGGIEAGERDLLEMWFHSLLSRVLRSELSVQAKEAKELSTRLSSAEKSNTALADRLDGVRQQQLTHMERHMMDSARPPNASIGYHHHQQAAAQSSAADMDAICVAVDRSIQRECGSVSSLVRQLHQSIGDVSALLHSRADAARTATTLDSRPLIAEVQSAIATHPCWATQARSSSAVESRLADVVTMLQTHLSASAPSTAVDTAEVQRVLEGLTGRVRELGTSLEGSLGGKMSKVAASVERLSEKLHTVVEDAMRERLPAAPPTPAVPQPNLEVMESMEGMQQKLEASSTASRAHHEVAQTKLDRILRLLEEKAALPPPVAHMPPPTHRDHLTPLTRSISAWLGSATQEVFQSLAAKATLFADSAATAAAASIQRAQQLTATQTHAARSQPPLAKSKQSAPVPKAQSSSEDDDEDDDAILRGKLKLTSSTATRAAATKKPVEDSLRFDDTMVSLDLSHSAADNSPPPQRSVHKGNSRSGGPSGGTGAATKLANWDDDDESSLGSSHSGASSESDEDSSDEGERRVAPAKYLSISSRGGGAAEGAKPSQSASVAPTSSTSSHQGKKSLPVW